jgi:hypothetical protein
MADDLAPAVLAHGSEKMYRALEAVERMCFSAGGHFKRLVVVISANLTNCHDTSPCLVAPVLIVMALHKSLQESSGSRGLQPAIKESVKQRAG